MWSTLKKVLQINTAAAKLALMCDRVYWTSQWHQNCTQNQLACLERIVRISTHTHNTWKWRKVQGGALLGNVSLWKSLRIMQVSVTLGSNSWLQWKHKRKTTRKEPRSWKWWCYSFTHSKQPANHKIYLLHGKGIDQVIDNLGTRLQV